MQNRRGTKIENNQRNLESWNEFLEEWIKTEHVKSWPAKVFIVSVKSDFNDKGKPIIIFSVQLDGGKYKWQPNITAMKKLKELNYVNPLKIVNKTVVMEKVSVYNPNTRIKQDGFEVLRVE